MRGLAQSVAQVKELRRIPISANQDLCRIKIELMAIAGIYILKAKGDNSHKTNGKCERILQEGS